MAQCARAIGLGTIVGPALSERRQDPRAAYPTHVDQRKLPERRVAGVRHRSRSVLRKLLSIAA